MKIKNPILLAVILFVIVFILFTAMINSAVSKNLAKGNKFLGMVNSTVLIYNDDGHGSGVFIDDDVILTAGHILRQPNLNVELSDGIILEVNNFYIDNKEDVGFIFIEANEPYISKIASLCGNIGDTVYLTGSPDYKDFKFTISKGILSHLDRDIWNKTDLLQTDAESAAGNSGGPLYNFDGDVIGICVSGIPGTLTLCESAESILEAYERCKNAAN